MEAEPVARSSGDVTGLLAAWRTGSPGALDRLLPLVYGELRRLASGQLRRGRRRRTLGTTALVHEAFLRLVAQRRAQWRDRGHFFAIAAKMMRRVVVDDARHRRYAKRGGGAPHVPLDEARDPPAPPGPEIVELDEALSHLATVDAGLARIVELRFFAGLTSEEIAAALDVSIPTITRRWRVARAWLYRYLTAENGRNG